MSLEGGTGTESPKEQAMTEPSIEVLGVYRLRVTEDLLRVQFDILWGDTPPAERPATAWRDVRDQLESVVLVEAKVLNPDERFDPGDFCQAREDLPQDQWQVAYDERYLTPDGNDLAVPRYETPKESGDLRIAFYLHFWDPALPLQSSYGEIACPAPQPMPLRLERLVPYEPVD